MAKRSKSTKAVEPQGPSAAYIMDLWRLKTSEGDEARLIRLAQEFRRLTKMTHTLKVPEAYRAITKDVRTPYVRDTWHRAVSALNQKQYVIHIEPTDDKMATERSANVGERWDLAVRDALDKEIGFDTSVESAKALIRDGESVLKIVHRPDAWANFPERFGDEKPDDYTERTAKYKKKTPIPFAWRIVDRLTTVWQDGEFGDEWVIELAEYPRAFIANRYKMTSDSNGYLVDPANPFARVDMRDVSPRELNPETTLGGMPKPWGWQNTPFGSCLKAEYFDSEFWAVVIDGRMAPGFPKANPYAPYLPYLRARGPDSESLLYSLLFLAPALDELLTMKLNWSHLGSYPNPVIHATPNAITGAFAEGDDGIPPPLEWKPGKAMTFPAGWTIDFLQPPPVGQDLNQLVDLLRAMIDVAGIPSVFRGVGGSDQAGYAINQLMAAASLSFRLASNSLGRQFSRAYEFMHFFVGHGIRQPVYVLGAGAGSKKQWLGLKDGSGINEGNTVAGVDDLGPVSVTFRVTLPTDEQARAMIAMQLVNAPKPLLSQRRALVKYLQEEDPEAVMDEIAVEDAMTQEPLKSMWIADAVKRAGLMPSQSAIPGQEGQPGMMPPNDQATAGEPAIPGMNQPMQPAPPPGPASGGPAGMFPGLPNTPINTAGQ